LTPQRTHSEGLWVPNSGYLFHLRCSSQRYRLVNSHSELPGWSSVTSRVYNCR